MDLIEGILTRRSIRAFKPIPVPREALEKVLEAAGRSPSYMNTQPWEVHLVAGKKRDEISRILSELAAKDTPPNPDIPALKEWPLEHERRYREHTERRFKTLGIEREDRQRIKELRMRNFNFHGAPCVLFLFIDRRLSAWSIFDMGSFAQSIALAAHSLGLGTCMQAITVGYPDSVRSFLGVPGSRLLVLGMPIGYPDPDDRINAYRSARVSPGDFITWDM